MTEIINPYKKIKTSLQLKARFVTVGIWNTVFGYLVFVVLDTLFESIFIKRYFAYMLAIVLGHIIANINAFIFNHKYDVLIYLSCPIIYHKEVSYSFNLIKWKIFFDVIN